MVEGREGGYIPFSSRKFALSRIRQQSMDRMSVICQTESNMHHSLIALHVCESSMVLRICRWLVCADHIFTDVDDVSMVRCVGHLLLLAGAESVSIGRLRVSYLD